MVLSTHVKLNFYALLRTKQRSHKTLRNFFFEIKFPILWYFTYVVYVFIIFDCQAPGKHYGTVKGAKTSNARINTGCLLEKTGSSMSLWTETPSLPESILSLSHTLLLHGFMSVCSGLCVFHPVSLSFCEHVQIFL